MIDRSLSCKASVEQEEIYITIHKLTLHNDSNFLLSVESDLIFVYILLLITESLVSV